MACVHHDCVRESVCVRERETVHVCIMTVCVCVRESVCVRERERLHVSSVHMCVRERETHRDCAT